MTKIGAVAIFRLVFGTKTKRRDPNDEAEMGGRSRPGTPNAGPVILHDPVMVM